MKTRSYASIATALALGFAVGCSDNRSELERQREMVKEVLAERKVDLSEPVVASSEHKFADGTDLTKICEDFMSRFGKGDMDSAFDLLEKHTPWPKAEMRALREQTKMQVDSVRPRYGEFVGHEKVKVEEIGSSLVRFQYLAKLENQALRCIFVFYRPDDRWVLNLFIWDDKVYLIDP